MTIQSERDGKRIKMYEEDDDRTNDGNNNNLDYEPNEFDENKNKNYEDEGGSLTSKRMERRRRGG